MEFQFENMCRTCMNDENDMVSIHDVHESERKTFAEMLMIVSSIEVTVCNNRELLLASLILLISNLSPVPFSLKVTVNDGLPIFICVLCKSQLISSFNFKLQSEQIDATLREVSVKTKTDEKELREMEETELITNILSIDLERMENRKSTNGLDEIKVELYDEEIDIKEEYLSEEVITEEEYLAMEAEENKTYTCDRCSREFAKLGTYLTHRKRYCLESYQCSDCTKSFKSKQDYRRHRRFHLRKEYKCEFCNKLFYSPHGFNYHMNVHLGKKEYACSFENCTKRFALKQALDKHMSVHSGGNNLCYLCGKLFASWDALHYHIKTHNGDRPHLCTHCGRTFKQACHLKAHMWIHSGVKPHECSVCKRCYTSGHQLKKHQKQYCLKRVFKSNS